MQSTPEQKGRDAETVHLVHRSHTNGVSCLVCERTLAVLRLHFQLFSRDMQVWREGNVRCLPEKMNAAATMLVSEE